MKKNVNYSLLCLNLPKELIKSSKCFLHPLSLSFCTSLHLSVSLTLTCFQHIIAQLKHRRFFFFLFFFSFWDPSEHKARRKLAIYNADLCVNSAGCQLINTPLTATQHNEPPAKQNILFCIHFTILHTTYWAIHAVHLPWLEPQLVSHGGSGVIRRVMSEFVKYI